MTAIAGASGGRPTARQLAERRAAFRKLHQGGCFVIPNPWDVGTARYLGRLGFQALATTSAGFAFSRGLPDTGAVTRDMALGHIAEIVAASDLPVNADFQAGHSRTPEGVGENVRLCVETGVAGLSIEDATGDPTRPLYDVALAVERIKAARAAIDASGADVLLTARARAEPTLTRRTPSSARSATVRPALQPMRTLTGFGATAFTMTAIASLSRGPGA